MRVIAKESDPKIWGWDKEMHNERGRGMPTFKEIMVKQGTYLYRDFSCLECLYSSATHQSSRVTTESTQGLMPCL